MIEELLARIYTLRNELFDEGNKPYAGINPDEPRLIDELKEAEAAFLEAIANEKDKIKLAKYLDMYFRDEKSNYYPIGMFTISDENYFRLRALLKSLQPNESKEKEYIPDTPNPTLLTPISQEVNAFGSDEISKFSPYLSPLGDLPPFINDVKIEKTEELLTRIFALRNGIFAEDNKPYAGINPDEPRFIDELKEADAAFIEAISKEKDVSKIAKYLDMYFRDEKGNYYPIDMFAISDETYFKYRNILKTLRPNESKEKEYIPDTPNPTLRTPESQKPETIVGEETSKYGPQLSPLRDLPSFVSQKPTIGPKVEHSTTESSALGSQLYSLGNLPPLRTRLTSDNIEEIFQILMANGFDRNDPVLVEFIPWFTINGYDRIVAAAKLDQQASYFGKVLHEISSVALSKNEKIKSIIESVYYINPNVNPSVVSSINQMGERVLNGIFSNPSSIERYKYLNSILKFDNEISAEPKSLT